ncbi:MAG: ABC transporter ATP-binding protein [Ruminococcaceae bacterium]|nr:ABC transporter ATP-binding protein [Oscillospiraceae bacterium]
MIKLIRYLRPYAGAVFLVFLLLFAQAITDLALPDYMSRIVNVGIQQNGIERAVPQIMRQKTFQQLQVLLDTEQSAEILSAYQTLAPGEGSSPEQESLVEQYPLLASEALAERKPDAPLSAKTESQLVSALALLTMVGQETFRLPALPANPSFLEQLGELPQEQRRQMLNQIYTEQASVPDSLIKQSAVAFTAAEYETIGVDLLDWQRRYILKTGTMMLLIALAGAACAVLVGYFAARVAAGVARDLRQGTFTRVESFSSAEFDTFSTASLITRTTNDVQQVQMALVMLMRILFFAPILGIGGIIKVLNSNVSLGWIIALAVAILMTLILVLFNIAVPRFKKIQKLVDRLNLVTREFLSGLMVIRAFNTEQHEEERFDQANLDLTKINLFVSRLMAMTMPLMMLVMNGISLLIVWTGARQVDLGVMQVGDIMAFIQYTMQIIMSFLMLSMVFIMLPRASVSAQRILEVLSVQLVILDPQEPAVFDPSARGNVVFENVSFRYPGADADVLHAISLTARPGETTAIIGSTGCGKSTLINLIPRFYDVSEGRVLVDGVDVRQVPQEELRQKIGYVSQKGILFTGSIRDNIAYGKPDASDDQIMQAAATAQADEFIAETEAGFATAIAQGGINVSGGQKQRLSIARALVRQPDIYIFDDSFSALDYKTDAALRKALRKNTQGASIIIVAQRIGTIRHAEQIIVLDEGRIAGLGTHEELMKTCSVYREIAISQLSEKELAL